MDSPSIRPGSPAPRGAATGGPRRVFVVAGMHRAGTSVVARGLQALGIELGDRLMSADQRMNARGFFEDMDIVGQNDALLDALGADWKNLALLDGVDWRAPALTSLRAEARQLLEARLAGTGQFGFKDPRVPRLLPFWQGIFAEVGAADAYVIAVRHPLSVIDSLTARDALDVRRSGWLWLTHLLCALHYTAGRPRVVVDYDNLLAAPARELARMAKGLGLPASALTAEDVTKYTRDFLSGELRHAEHASAELDCADVPQLMRDVPQLMRDGCALTRRLACDDADIGAAATNAEVGALFGRLAAMSPLLAYAGAVERAADEVPRLTGELAWARASIVAASAFNENLQAAIAIGQTYNDDLVATLQRKEEELVAAHAKLARIGERALGRMVLRRIERQP